MRRSPKASIRPTFRRGIAVAGMALSLGTSPLARAALPATSPATSPATGPAGFSAFHGGGGLLGEAEAIGGPPMSVRWTYKTDDADPAGVEGAAAIAGGVAYVGDDRGTLHAIDLATGKARWKYKAEDGLAATPLVVGGRVFVGDLGGLVHAVSVEGGKKLWTFDSEAAIHGAANYAPAPAGAPGSGQGYVLFGNDSGGIFCLDVTGDARLPRPVVPPVPASPATRQANAGEKLGAGNNAPPIAGADAPEQKARPTTTPREVKPDPKPDAKPDDKMVVWRQQAGDRVNGAPAVSDRAAFFSGCDAQLRALSLKDGAELFAADMGALSGGSPALLKDRIIIGTDRGRVACFSGDGKQQLWVYEGVANNAMVFSSPAVAQGVAVIGARDRQVHAIDVNTGKALWAFPTRGDVDSSPLVSGGRVYVGSKDKKLYVLDLKTGAELWQFTAGRAIAAPPAIAEGVLVIGDVRGSVYCLEAKK